MVEDKEQAAESRDPEQDYIDYDLDGGYTRVGTISHLEGHPMSGLWQLVMQDGDGTISTVHIESGYGVRALAAAFGASEGCGDLQEKVSGQDIVYSTDAVGVLAGFTPLQKWIDAGMPEIPEEAGGNGKRSISNEDLNKLMRFLSQVGEGCMPEGEGD